jgi:hypothetical protein
MKFKLIYYGELMTNPKKRSQHISDIRMKFHNQLKQLVELEPWNHLKEHMMLPVATKQPIITKNIGGVEFNPIISDKMKMFAELDITMLHPESVGFARADIDNRIKTLMDGLRAPQNAHEIGENTPKNMGPIYTLLDDDHLVSKLSVNTSHLLTDNGIFSDNCAKKKSAKAEENPKLFLLINVKLRLSEGTLDNLPFMV